MLKKVLKVRNVGRFETVTSIGRSNFSKLNLIFGENGWGKSTLADILRSLDQNRPEILIGRKTLARSGDQEVRLLVGTNHGQHEVIFNGHEWTGTTPSITIFDQQFINENMHSGEVVTHDHLKHQYGLVIGDDGTKIVQNIQQKEIEERSAKESLQQSELELKSILTNLNLPNMNVDDFAKLDPLKNPEAAISNKQVELKRACDSQAIMVATLPNPLPLPTESEEFESILFRSLETVTKEVRRRLQKHIEDHHIEDSDQTISHEGWLQQGLTFLADDNCPFCGQHLKDRELVDLYSEYFSTEFAELANRVHRSRQTLGRYNNGDFRHPFTTAINANESAIQNLSNLTSEQFLGTVAPEEIISSFEEAGLTIDSAFQIKQRDLASKVDFEPLLEALSIWKNIRSLIETYNSAIENYNSKIKKIQDELKKAGNNSELIFRDLAVLNARVKRYECDVEQKVTQRNALKQKVAGLVTKKTSFREQLKNYSETIIADIESEINTHLADMGAGFSIDYKPTNFRGAEPAAKYEIRINDIPVPLRANDETSPSFPNTLSTGDKSALALAFFLATVNAEKNISDMIVVLDDPFTSMDIFRRRFTANQIKLLADKAKQVIVLSHEKSFLRLLWDISDCTDIASLAIQTGAPGQANFIHMDIETETDSRQKTDRDKIHQFFLNTEGDVGTIRSLLRSVLEGFYRNVDPSLFNNDDLLVTIINKINDKPDDYLYKSALDQLNDINEYSRVTHHAEVSGSGEETTSTEELRTCCRKVLDLTTGSA